MVTMLCLLLALFVNENSIIAYAASSSQTESGCVSVQFGSTPVSDINNLDGMVSGHDLDLKLKITSNDGEQTKDNITLEDNSMNNIVYDSTYTYTYTLTSENYDLILAGYEGMTYSQKAKGFTFDENKKFTLVIEKVIPKYTFTLSPTITNPLAQGSSTEFSVNIIPESWNDQIVKWTVLGGSEYVSITTDNNKCIVTVNDSLDSENFEIALNAFAPNRQQMSKWIKLGKTPVALSVESQTGDWDAITITAATNPVLSDVELKLVVPSSVEGEQGTVYTATTNKDGKAVFTVALTEDSTLNYQIEYAGNNTYKSAVTASQSYTPTKKTPVLTLASSDNANACGSEIKIGTISSSVVDDQKQLFSSEAITDGKQNGTVRIDENGYVYYTPSASGTAVIKITREEDAKYNAVFVSTTVSVVKKNVTIHIGGTEVGNTKDAICTEDGYTGDTYCLGCGAKLSDGVPITKLGHIDDNKNHECDRENCKATISSHIGGTATCKDKAVCSVCGEEYGEADATNHTTFTHTEAKAATVTETGNTEYWYCNNDLYGLCKSRKDDYITNHRR